MRSSERRNPARMYTGIALILGPTLMLAATIVGLAVDADDAAERFQQIAENETAYVLSGILFLLATLLLLGASVGLIHLFRTRGAKLGQLASILLLLGSSAGAGFYMFGALEYAMATSEGVDRAELARFVEQAEESAVFLPIFILFLAGIVLGLILLGIAAWRRRIVPVWAAILIVAAGVLAFAAEEPALSIVSFVVLLGGLGWLGQVILRMPEEQWAAGDRSVGAAAPSDPSLPEQRP